MLPVRALRTPDNRLRHAQRIRVWEQRVHLGTCRHREPERTSDRRQSNQESAELEERRRREAERLGKGRACVEWRAETSREGQQGGEREVRTFVLFCVLIECTFVVDVPVVHARLLSQPVSPLRPLPFLFLRYQPVI